MQKRYWDKFFRLLLVLSITAAVIFIIKFTFTYTYPFLVALLLAFLLDPFVNKMEKSCNWSRSTATLTVMATIICFGLLIGYFFLQRVVKEFLELSGRLPSIFYDIQKDLLAAGQRLYDTLITMVPFLQSWDMNADLHSLLDQMAAFGLSFFKNMMLTTTNTVASLSYFAVIFLFIMIAAFMMTKDLPLLKTYGLALLPDTFKKHVHSFFIYSKQSVMGLLKAQLFMTALSALLIGIFLFMFKVNHVLTITLLVFLVDFIPYLGIGIVFLPWLSYCFFTGQYVFTIKLAALYIGIIILRQALEPKIIAKQIGIHPLIALSILFIGIQALGIIGILLTPAILICMSALYRVRVFHAVWDFIQNGHHDST